MNAATETFIPGLIAFVSPDEYRDIRRESWNNDETIGKCYGRSYYINLEHLKQTLPAESTNSGEVMADVEEVERFLTAPGNDCKYSVAISSGNTFGNLTENRALFNNMMRVEAYCFNSQNFMLIKYDNTPPADAYVIHFDAARGKYFWIDSDDKVSQTNFALPGTSG